MTPMQEKFEKWYVEKYHEELEEIEGVVPVDDVKAWIGRAEIEGNIRMLDELDSYGVINKRIYDGGEGISIYHKFKNRLKEQTGEKAQAPKA